MKDLESMQPSTQSQSGQMEDGAEEKAKKAKIERELYDSLGVQQTTMRLMVPERLRQYVKESDGEHMGIEDGLFQQWQSKYALLFRNFYDQLREGSSTEERDFAERIRSGLLTSADYAKVQQYLEAPAQENTEKEIGGKFFKDAEEIDDFLKTYLH